MPRYIDADALNAYIESAECNSVGKALQAIDNAPTISPDEVRGVGEWEHQELAPTNYTFCSCCGFLRAKNYKWRYCPSCGARMKGADDDL